MTAGVEAWRAGHLVAARTAWREVVARQRLAWSAAYHLARLDAAFGALRPEQVAELDHAGLADPARRRVDALAAALEAPSSLGAIEDWEIDALRVAGRDADAPWWVERGRRAWGAGLLGLAEACIEEACDRDPGLYDDPPRWAQGIATQIDQLLDAVGTA